MAQESAATTSVEHQNGASGEIAVVFASFKPQLSVPSLRVDEAVQFYKAAFGAEEVKRVKFPKRKADQEIPFVLSAELKIGSTSFLVCDQEDGTAAVKTGDGGVSFQLEAEDVRKAVSAAVKAGAAVEGDSVEEDGASAIGAFAKLKDPFGHAWTISALAKESGDAEAEA